VVASVLVASWARWSRSGSLAEQAVSVSVASAAAVSTGALYMNAMPALLAMTGTHLPLWARGGWTLGVGALGVGVALSLHDRFIRVERLPFPSGTAAARTLRALDGDAEEVRRRARALSIGLAAGILLAWFREVRGTPAMAEFWPAWLTVPATLFAWLPYTFGLDVSGVLWASGALMGMRTAISMALGALVAYGVGAPALVNASLGGDGSYRGLLAVFVWPAATLLVLGGWLAFAARARVRSDAPHDDTPAAPPEGRRFAWTIGGLGAVATWAVGVTALGLSWWHVPLAIALASGLAVVAARTTGESDVTPTGPLGKLTQLAFGVCAPRAPVTNLAAASVTAGASASAADLLTDFRVGEMTGVPPLRQAHAHVVGLVIGTLTVAPLFAVLVPSADDLFGDRWPAPAAQVWRSVARVLGDGVGAIPFAARAASAAAVVLALVLAALPYAFRRKTVLVPSTTALGLGILLPASASLALAFGAIAGAVATARFRSAPELVPVFLAGLLAGDSLCGVAVAFMQATGVLR
jgi:uncharacterized oligopeptide transporter (OPT) family protein